MGITVEHVTTYWYAGDEAIINPKTNETDFLYDHYHDCDKYFPNFESEYNDFEKLLCDCIGMTLQEDISNALLAETLDDIIKLKTAYSVKSYFPESNLDLH